VSVVFSQRCHLSPDVIGAITLTAMAGVFHVLDMADRIDWLALRHRFRFLRGWFRSKHSTTIIVLLWPTGVGVGMATYTSPIPKDFFYLSYALLAAATFWSVGAFLCSSFLSNKKVKRHSNQRGYRGWQVIVPLLILTFGGFCFSGIRHIQVARDLLEMNGILIPANDLDPVGPCDESQSPAVGALKLYFGGITVMTWGMKADVIRRPPPPPGQKYDPVLLGIERDYSGPPGLGSVAVHANVIGNNNKLIARIDRNHFEIARNRLLDPFSPPRRDKSTIDLTDEDGNTLTIRLINEHSVSFSGTLYIQPGTYVEVNQNGLHISPTNQGIGAGFCFPMINPNSAVVGVP